MFRQPSQAGCGGAVVLLAPELQEQNSGCVAQLFHCGSVVGSCYVASQVLSGNKELKTTQPHGITGCFHCKLHIFSLLT